MEDMFSNNYSSPISDDFRIGKIELEGKFTRLQFWDASAQEPFQMITISHRRAANAMSPVGSRVQHCMGEMDNGRCYEEGGVGEVAIQNGKKSSWGTEFRS
jgi:hypothetical protein